MVEVDLDVLTRANSTDAGDKTDGGVRFDHGCPNWRQRQRVLPLRGRPGKIRR
jgi:hypothetical protein